MCQNDVRGLLRTLAQPGNSQHGACSGLQSQRVLTSNELLGEEGELIIVHNDCRYSLRLTRQNKLILTK